MGTFFFVIVVGIGVVIGILLNNRKVKEAWSTAAKKLRLDFSDGVGGGSMKGQRVGIHLEVKSEVVGRSTWTTFRAEFPDSLPFPIRLQPQTFLSNLGNTIRNGIDLETGDSRFDPKVIVESPEPEQVRKFLDKKVRSIVMKLISRFDEFELSESRVTVKHRRLVSNVNDLVEDVRVLENSVRDLWESAVPQAVTKPVPPPLPLQNEAEDQEEETAEEKPGETSELSVVPLPATDVIEQVRQDRRSAIPEEEVSQKFETQLGETVESPERIAVSYDPLFAHHCREIFSESQGRYGMKKQFETELLGSEVNDRFILKSEEPYSMHRVFGRGPGTLRTFSLGNLPDGNELLLVVGAIADSSRQSLHAHSGELDSVEGSLVSFDPFSYTLFLRERREEAEGVV